MADKKDTELAKDVQLQQMFVCSGKHTAISPSNVRCATSLLANAHGIASPLEYSHKGHEYLKVVGGLFGDVPSLKTEPEFLCIHDRELNIAKINDFVATATDQQIPELLAPGTPMSSGDSVVVVASHYKAPWVVQFDPLCTCVLPFHGSGGQVKVSTMNYDRTAICSGPNSVKHKFIDSQNLRSFILPYKDPRFVAVFTRHIKDDEMHLGEKLESLQSEYEQHLAMDASQIREDAVCTIQLPKFRLQCHHEDILEQLKAVGVGNHFIAKTGVTRVIHSLFIEIDEQGTEGAAATAMVSRSCHFFKRTWIGNVPFLFAIRDMETRCTLFSGLIDFTNF